MFKKPVGRPKRNTLSPEPATKDGRSSKRAASLRNAAKPKISLNTLQDCDQSQLGNDA